MGKRPGAALIVSAHQFDAIVRGSRILGSQLRVHDTVVVQHGGHLEANVRRLGDAAAKCIAPREGQQLAFGCERKSGLNGMQLTVVAFDLIATGDLDGRTAG